MSKYTWHCGLVRTLVFLSDQCTLLANYEWAENLFKEQRSLMEFIETEQGGFTDMVHI